ncbi:MAG: hypothetical protein OXI49_06710 [Acidobacteriota bacterium]|nr:hypothetical protein [Acidobacteriota bacterium]
MTAAQKSVAGLLAAVWRTMRSPAWLGAVGNEEERAAMIVLAVAESLDGAAPTASTVRAELGRARRNARIKKQFDGANYSAIARRHGLSVRQVRRIIDGR